MIVCLIKLEIGMLVCKNPKLRAVLRIFAPQTSCWGEGAIFFLILYVWGRCDGGGVHVLIAGAGDHGQSITRLSKYHTQSSGHQLSQAPVLPYSDTLEKCYVSVSILITHRTHIKIIPNQN